jgi:hypothetical protein
MKAALAYLAEKWPRAVPFAELLEAAEAQHAPTEGTLERPIQKEMDLANRLWIISQRNLVELHRVPPRFALQAGERPVGYALARRQAEAGVYVTNLRHETVTLDATGRAVLSLLDGTRTRGQVQEELGGLLAQLARSEGKPDVTQPASGGDSTGVLDKVLAHFAQSALLMP